MYSSKLPYLLAETAEEAAVDAVPVDVVDANASAYKRMLRHAFNSSKHHFLSTMPANH